MLGLAVVRVVLVVVGQVWNSPFLLELQFKVIHVFDVGVVF